MTSKLKEITFSTEAQIKLAAIESAPKNGLKGGFACARSFSAKQRSEIAKKAAKARWAFHKR